MRRLIGALLLTSGLWSGAADAQTALYQSGDTNHQGTVAPAVNECLNGSNNAVPCSAANPLPAQLSNGGSAVSGSNPLPVAEQSYIVTPPGTSSNNGVPIQPMNGSLGFPPADAGNTSLGTGSGTCASTCNGTALFSLDTSGFATVDMYFTSVGTSDTVTMQESDDNSTWVTHTGCFNGNNQLGTTVTNGSAGPNLSQTCPVHKRYFRAQFTAYASGTITAFWVARHQWYLPETTIPYGATQISGNGTGTTGAVVGTLTGAANVFTYICGFNVQAIGGTAAVGPITVAGLIGSSQVYQGSSSAAGGTVTSQTFQPCIRSSAVNTSITVSTTADGTATAVDVNSWGYTR